MRGIRALMAVSSLLTMGLLQADVIDLQVENERQQYLLYEPLVFRVTLTNNAGQDLVFEDPGNGRSWLDFVVVNDSNHAIIKKDHPAVFKKMLLASGATRALEINITPLYRIRETGSFHIQTVIQVGGREFVSEPTGVTIVNGHSIWQNKRTVDGSLYTYSLIRFTPDPQNTFIYLRIESEAENTVFTTERLGEVVSFTDPQTSFDTDNNLHILHVNGKGSYRYTRVDAQGHLLSRENFSSVNESQPQLFTTKDGSVLVQGGRKDNEANRRELLSVGQTLIRKAPEKRLAETPASAPSAGPPPPGSGASNPPH